MHDRGTEAEGRGDGRAREALAILGESYELADGPPGEVHFSLKPTALTRQRYAHRWVRIGETRFVVVYNSERGPYVAMEQWHPTPVTIGGVRTHYEVVWRERCESTGEARALWLTTVKDPGRVLRELALEDL